jgi:carbon monoxide dehydrogenase subunit G
VRVGIEAVKGTYRGTATVRDRRPHDSYELVVQGTGIPGGLGGEARIALRDDGDGTLVSYRGEITAQGTLARLGARLLAGTAKLMIGQFFKAMEKQVAQRVA